jgi:hypothetical protein
MPLFENARNTRNWAVPTLLQIKLQSKMNQKKSGGRRYSDVASLSSGSFAANAARLLLDDMSRPSLTPMFPKRLVKDPWK